MRFACLPKLSTFSLFQEMFSSWLDGGWPRPMTPWVIRYFSINNSWCKIPSGNSERRWINMETDRLTLDARWWNTRFLITKRSCPSVPTVCIILNEIIWINCTNLSLKAKTFIHRKSKQICLMSIVEYETWTKLSRRFIFYYPSPAHSDTSVYTVRVWNAGDGVSTLQLTVFMRECGVSSVYIETQTSAMHSTLRQCLVFRFVPFYVYIIFE